MQVPTTAPPLLPFLQDWFAESGGALGDWFGGGLVRVEMARDMSSSAQIARAGVGAGTGGLESLNAWVQVEPSPAASELLHASAHHGASASSPQVEPSPAASELLHASAHHGASASSPQVEPSPAASELLRASAHHGASASSPQVEPSPAASELLRAAGHSGTLR